MARQSDLTLYARLLKEARPHWLLIGALFLLSLLSTPIALLMPLPLKIAIDSVLASGSLPASLQALFPAGIPGSQGALLLLATAAVLAIAVCDQVQKLGMSVLGTYTGEKLALDFRAKLFRH